MGSGHKCMNGRHRIDMAFYGASERRAIERGVALKMVTVMTEIIIAHCEKQHHRYDDTCGNNGRYGPEIIDAFTRAFTVPRHKYNLSSTALPSRANRSPAALRSG